MTKIDIRTLFKTLSRVFLFVILLILPLLLRAGYYYHRFYVPRSVPRPDHAAVELPTVAQPTFDDADFCQGEGRVIIDRAHDNTLDETELNVLLARLTARGMDSASLTPGDNLADMLHNASALIVIAPHQSFYSWEIRAVESFVERGGRVLLVADPGRYSYRFEYDEYGYEYMVPNSDVAAINSLASPFGLSFADDYIYNTATHAGNYQYVILQDFAPNQLTTGLDSVIFYAAHSIAAGEQKLITADDHTTSSLSEQTGGLTTMSLGGDGQVLAVADFTFMTEPYNTSADNNRLIANIADFIAAAERSYRLSDFPYLFADEVDLILLPGQAEKSAFAPEVIDQSYILQSSFESAGKTLRLQGQLDDERDAILIGLYNNVEFSPQVGEILLSQGISLTLETAERERATPTPTSLSYTQTPTPTQTPARDWLHVPGLGQVEAKEIALIYHGRKDGRQLLMALAFSQDGLNAAIQRLILGDFTRCLMDENLTLCPTSYEPSEEGPSLTPTPTPEGDLYATPTPAPAAEGGILIVADDDGEGVYEWWTSAYDFESIVRDSGYQATIWSTSWDGDVTLEQMQSYDALIWCTGDYQEETFTPAEDDLVTISTYLEGGGRVILSGAFLGETEDRESGLLLDMQVAKADHPLSEGFEAEQIITLERFTANEDYSPFVLDETDSEAIVFTRGPASESAGAALIAVDKDEYPGSKTIFIGFPIYLMPWEEEYQLGLNAISWLMEE